ncbi:alpha-2-HS-glycoprotein-like isoform X2 [Festucalex cinctus]
MLAHLSLVVLCCLQGLLGVPSASPPPPSLLSDSFSVLPLTVTCDEADVTTAARFGVRVIDEKRKHGFKFKLHQVQGSKYQQLSEGNCDIDVDAKLLQTKCHFSNPKPEDHCDVFRQGERGTWATCAIKLSVRGKAAVVTTYECVTKPEPSNKQVSRLRPDFPALLPLNDPTALKAAHKAVRKFNKESQLGHFFDLLEVSHVTIGYMQPVGMITWVMLALVETKCPREATHTFAPCTPLCPHRAFN